MAVLGVLHSIMGMRWEKKEGNDRQALALSQRFNLPAVVADILTMRGLDIDTVESFLKPTLKEHLPDPDTLKDMSKAAERMAKAVLAQQPIGIMGDYDVDGATSTAILKLYLSACGIDVHVFIPDREDGYGPNAQKMQEFHRAGCSVVATLDCGITAFDPIQAGTDLGIDVIVLDHHSPEKTLPNAYAVVNPKRLDEPLNHPCRQMAAVGVVFLFVIALNRLLRQKGFFKTRPEPDLLAFLDLVALGTVCDVVSLKGVNRLFVKAGLRHLMQQKNLGIKALAQNAAIQAPFEAYHLGYVLGPRINACGRIGKSDTAMRLLSCHDPVQAQELAQELEQLNLLRRDIEADVLLQAIEQVESQPLETPFLFVKGTNWHQGVIGIVAGRLKDKYNLPVFALSIEGDEVKGSSRSTEGIDLGTLIMNALTAGVLTRGGGHAKAAGFSLKTNQIEDFYQYLKDHIVPDAVPTESVLEIDGIMDMRGITIPFMDQLALLEPFGEANPEPEFVIQNVMICRPLLLKNGHISCILQGQSGGSLSAIAFRVADTAMGQTLLNHGNRYYHVAGHLKKDVWKGQVKIQVQIDDLATA